MGSEQLGCASLVSLGFYLSSSLLFIVIVITISIISGIVMFYFVSII